ncbi:hypothetical protein TSAR_008149 [Trichomalopsis sarcophagae]|uniref:Uncharacterized protein n=1 Tax=Trichomalopsis sarcophagae TaxID=543379 RepID=A0A232EH62_9HYME|nr:hypothetical protein TSAR_008149 [Trichomalopsis sarcophagae]
MQTIAPATMLEWWKIIHIYITFPIFDDFNNLGLSYSLMSKTVLLVRPAKLLSKGSEYARDIYYA